MLDGNEVCGAKRWERRIGIERLLEEKSKKLYWSVWFYNVEKQCWMHHGSYDSQADARDEARRLRDGGEKVEVRRQEW